MKPVPDPVHVAIEYTLRQDRGRLIAALTAVIGDLELAEECLQDAIEIALKEWTANNIPKSRIGWLLQVARRRALDRLRRSVKFHEKAAQIRVLEQAHVEAPDESHDIADHRLRLIFTCCHPALDEKTRIALTLRTLGGLTTEEVARAYLDKTSAMAQRLSRARSKISKAGIPFAIPDASLLPERIKSVLSVIYLIFNEGYAATMGEVPVRVDLCDEAIYLSRLMVQFCPDEPEILGLLALMLLSHARRNARLSSHKYVPLSDQDRRLWDCTLITEGQKHIDSALRAGRVGPYQIQASISALHCEAVTSGATDWAQIAALYRVLVQIQPSAVVRLNLAVALVHSKGAEHALNCLNEMANELDGYQPYHAARADILRRLGRTQQARKAYEAALALSHVKAEAEFLKDRIDTL